MQSKIIEMGGSGPPMLFAHANGYPPGSYQHLLTLLSDRFSVFAIEHRPLWAERSPPRKLHWSLFADDMLKVLADRFDGPLWVMGHSMGAVTAVLAAAREPERFTGLMLLDPVFLPERYVWATRLTPRSRITKVPMIRRALNRPEFFEGIDAAFDFYRGKRAFKGLTDEALRDYVTASNEPMADGRVRLRYSPAWEAAVYASPPRVRHVLKALDLPTLGLRGQASDTLSPQVWKRWQRWQPDAHLQEIPGGHLFPLEYPHETASIATAFAFCR